MISLLLLAVDVVDEDIVDVNGVVDVNVVVDDNVVVVKANRAVVDFVVVVVDTVVVSRKISIVGFKVGGNLVFKHRPFLNSMPSSPQITFLHFLKKGSNSSPSLHFTEKRYKTEKHLKIGQI